MTRLKPNHDLYAKIAINEARFGDLGPLIARVSVPATRAKMTDEEWKLVVAVLESSNGDRGRKRLKAIEKALTSMRYEGLIEEDKLKPKQALDKVMKERGIKSRQTVYNAMKPAKNKR